MARIAAPAIALAVACCVAACGGSGGGTPTAPSPSSTPASVRAWTGTIEITSNHSGTGNSNFGGMDILEVFQQETIARLNVSLTANAAGARQWTGTAQGSVRITNRNTMTMVSPGALVTCTGTLNWIGNDPVFSAPSMLDADSNLSTIRVSVQRVRIPAPDSGGVVCPFSSLNFPTVDPNSPFAPNELLSGVSMTPSSSGNQSLFAFTVVPGDSGLGGFTASAARIPYQITVNLTAVP